MNAKLLLFLIGLSFSLAAYAKVDSSACTSITNQINADINKYSTELQNQSLPWKDLNWLEQQLGPYSITISEFEDVEAAKDLRKYTWKCDNTGAYLTIFVDPHNKIVKVIGQYSGREGSGIFATDFNSTNIKKFPMNDNIKSCANIIKAIEKDAKTQSYSYIDKPGSLQEKSPPDWFNLNWLQHQLGAAETITYKQNLYVWKNYQLLVFDGKSKQASGDANLFNKIPSLDEALNVLGSPDKNYVEEIKRYTWHCPELPQIMISTVASNNTIIDLSFSACPIQNCDAFKFNWEKSQLEKQVSIVTGDKTEAMEKLFAGDPTKFQADNVANAKAFYANLRDCKPGTFQFNHYYPMAGSVVVTADIQGNENNSCHFNMKYILPKMGDLPKDIHGETKCQIPMEKLILFTEQAAKELGEGNINSESPINILMQKSCQVYLNGERIQPD